VPYIECPDLDKLVNISLNTQKTLQVKESIHKCNAILFAEDNPNVLKK